jgi:hypothetical protein
MQGWIRGYISGYQVASGQDMLQLRHIGGADIDEWFARYCNNHPEEKIFVAAHRFVDTQGGNH